MKDHFPGYRKDADIEIVYRLMKDKDKGDLKNFISYCKVTCSDIRAKMLRRMLLQIYDITEKSFDNIDHKTLINFLMILNQSKKLSSTKNGIKKLLKRFPKWKFKDWAIRFDEFKVIKLESPVRTFTRS